MESVNPAHLLFKVCSVHAMPAVSHSFRVAMDASPALALLITAVTRAAVLLAMSLIPLLALVSVIATGDFLSTQTMSVLDAPLEILIVSTVLALMLATEYSASMLLWFHNTILAILDAQLVLS